MLQYVVNRTGATTPAPVSAPAPASTPGQRGRVVVGGIDYAVGGWGEYEIGRRRERWEISKVGGAAVASERPGLRYGGRTYVYADDVVRSVLAGSRMAVGGGGGAQPKGSALQRAALRLADALGRMEDRLCNVADDGVWECEPPSALASRTPAESFTVPAITSADLRAFASDPEQTADPDALSELSDDVLSVAAAVGTPLPALPSLVAPGLPPLPVHAVPVSDDEAVLRLEAAVEPYVASVEGLQAALAGQLDAAAAAVETALGPR